MGIYTWGRKIPGVYLPGVYTPRVGEDIPGLYAWAACVGCTCPQVHPCVPSGKPVTSIIVLPENLKIPHTKATHQYSPCYSPVLTIYTPRGSKKGYSPFSGE